MLVAGQNPEFDLTIVEIPNIDVTSYKHRYCECRDHKRRKYEHRKTTPEVDIPNYRLPKLIGPLAISIFFSFQKFEKFMKKFWKRIKWVKKLEEFDN